MSLAARVSGFSFNHLMGLGGRPKAGKRAEDDEEKRRPEDEDDSGKGRRAEIDDEDQGRRDDDDDDSGKGKRAEDDEDGEQKAKKRADVEDGDEDGDEDDDEEEMKKARAAGFGPALAAARRAERRRVGRICSHAAAAGRIASALHLACNTRLSAKEAVGLLGTVPTAEKPRNSALAEAMSRVPQPAPGGNDGTPATPAHALAAAGKRMAEAIAARKAKHR